MGKFAALVFFAVLMAACDENAGAPSEATPEIVCEHWRASGCPQGFLDECVQVLDMESAEFPDCAAQRNDLRRCYYLDLPADAEEELKGIPQTCVLSEACKNEGDSLCYCERGPECGYDY